MSLKQQWSLLQGPIVICNSNFSPHFTGTRNGAQPGKGTLSSWYEAGRVGGSSYISASVCICTNLQSISLVKLFWSDRFISKIVYLISFNHLLFKLIHMFRCCFLRWNPIYCGKIINQETLSTFLGWMHLPRGQGKSTSSNTDLYHLARAWPTGGIHLYHYMNDVTDTWIKTARKTYFSSIRAGFLVGKIKLYTQIKMCMQRNRGIKLPGVFQNRQRFWCKQTSAPGRGKARGKYDAEGGADCNVRKPGPFSYTWRNIIKWFEHKESVLVQVTGRYRTSGPGHGQV